MQFLLAEPLGLLLYKSRAAGNYLRLFAPLIVMLYPDAIVDGMCKGSRAPIGYIAIAANEICTNQGFKSIIPDKSKVDSEFLYYTLKNRVEEIKDLGVGTTFAEISGKVLENFEIDLPNLDDQKKHNFPNRRHSASVY